LTTISARERDAVIQSLRAGVVPRVGQHLVQVGRLRELESLIQDVDRVAAGGPAFRLVIGEYGSGKTFFLNLVRAVGLERKLVVANADLNPDRRLHSTGGQARSLYGELMRTLATRTKPEGGALAAIVEKFISTVSAEAKISGATPSDAIHAKLEPLKEMVGGYDFVDVITSFWRGFEEGSDQLKSDATRWLRAEFTTRTEARQALGIRTIIDDASFYDHLKLLARFTRLAGYSGLLVCLDEMVNLYKLSSTQARNSNYEQVLRILNDSLQGSAEGLGWVFGGTPDFVFDTRRGLYSYAALQSRLAQNTFAKNGLVDFTGPIVRLANLSPEDFYVLLQKVRHVCASGDPAKYLLPDEGLNAFMLHSHKQLGDAYFRTPRTTITAFVNLLAVLEQNPDATWQALLEQVQVPKDEAAKAELLVAGDTPGPDDELTSFKL